MTNTTRPLTDEEKDRHVAEAEKARAEARHFIAQAIEAEARAEVAGYVLAEAREREQQRVNSDDHHHVYRFSGEVADGTVRSCISTLNKWHRLDPECDIEIIFNSPGGSMIDGMALFDQLVSFSLRGGGTHKVTVGSLGYAASMAGILLQAGDVRWIGKQSFLMIHEISSTTGGKIGEIRDDVKFYDAICARVVDIFVDRSEGKCTKRKFVNGWERTDWWMLSDEALELGFVDEVR